MDDVDLVSQSSVEETRLRRCAGVWGTWWVEQQLGADRPQLGPRPPVNQSCQPASNFEDVLSDPDWLINRHLGYRFQASSPPRSAPQPPYRPMHSRPAELFQDTGCVCHMHTRRDTHSQRWGPVICLTTLTLMSAAPFRHDNVANRAV